MSQDREPVGQRPGNEVWPGTADLDAQLADLVAYCRDVTGQESDAVSTAHAVLNSARSQLTDPGQLRAWLFALARFELLAGSEPDAREVFDLVHRHGIHPEDLPVVLGIPPTEADQVLAAAEADGGAQGWDDRPGSDDSTHLIEGQPGDDQLAFLVAYCRTLTSRDEDAVSTAHSVIGVSQSLLTDPDRRRAWLFALARQEMLADASPAPQEVLDLVHRHGIRAEDLPTVLGISPAEADKLLAAAEDQYASSAFGYGQQEADALEADALPGEGWHDDRSWDDRAEAWDRTAGWDEGADAEDAAAADNRADWDNGADWDNVFGPKSRRLQDLYGLIRKPPELAGRHAAPASGGAGLRRALARGPVRVAAATAIVVAVIGVSAAYLAAQHSPPPSQASQQPKHHPAPSPATSPSLAPTATPTLSPSPSHTVTVVLPPAPAPTSPRPSPKPSPKPSPSPTSPSPTPTSPSPTPTGTP